MNAHTPGPWEYVPSTNRCGPYITSAYGDVSDCYVMSTKGRLEPNHFQGVAADANARLIAAAPDLFAALTLALKQITDLEDVLNAPNHQVYGWHLNGASEPASNFFEENDCGAVTAARAAIARATGTAP